MPVAERNGAGVGAALLASGAAGQVAAAGVDDPALLLLRDLRRHKLPGRIVERVSHFRMYAEVLAACEPEPGERALLGELLGRPGSLDAVLHEALELCERLLNLGDRPGAVDQLALDCVELGRETVSTRAERGRSARTCW
jgi:hypothetical protein